LRELRDQLRDRRTLFMVVALPLLLYPVLGFAVLKFALGFAERPSTIGVVREPGGGLDFPARVPPHAGLSIVPDLGCLAATSGAYVPSVLAACAAGHDHLDYPLFIQGGRFNLRPAKTLAEHAALVVSQAQIRLVWLDSPDADALKTKDVDL